VRNREDAPATPYTGELRSARDRSRVFIRCTGSASLVAVALISTTPALALWDDKVTPFVEEKVTHDDNVFRVPNSADPASDTYHTTSLGLNLDVPVSRQRFQAGYTWNATRFKRFTSLDFDGHDAKAIWGWQFGNDLSGQLGYAETLALASFAYLQSTTPDPLKTRVAILNAAYLVTPRWRVQGGVNEFRQANGDPTLNPNGLIYGSLELSADYLPVLDPAHNTVTRVPLHNPGGCLWRRYRARREPAGLPLAAPTARRGAWAADRGAAVDRA